MRTVPTFTMVVNPEDTISVPAASRTIHTTSLDTKTPLAMHSRVSSSQDSSSSSSSAGASSSSLRLPTSHNRSANRSDDSLNNITADYVLAMHDYDSSAATGGGQCLSFKAGQVIRVYNRDPSGWWDGELEGRRGWFPSNYVSEDVTADISPAKAGKRRRHARLASTASVMSTVSWGTDRSSGSGSSYYGEIVEEEEDDFSASESHAAELYCPPTMVPLLHALALLQGAVRGNRVAHFQPSTACIISCVRTILAGADCLPRDAPVLRQYPIIAKARKGLLSDLAGLVTQARKASAELPRDPQDQDATEEEGAGEREVEIERMLKRAGRVFANVRRFLALAEECGVEVAASRGVAPANANGSAGATPMRPKTVSRAQTHQGVIGQTPKPTSRGRASSRAAQDEIPALRTRSADGTQHDSGVGGLTVDTTPAPRSKSSNHTHRTQPSITSTSSMSSVQSSSTASSSSTAETPPTPPFPAGSSSATEIMDILRHTHNQYLSTIAAFVGQSHSYSRASHASSTTHMYDLARDIVEMVCKLLTVLDAVQRHPDLARSPTKLAGLRAAKDGLYTVTRAFAEAVRLLTHPSANDSLDNEMTEESERAALQRAATDALKAGADCVGAIKMALNRTSNRRESLRLTLAPVEEGPLEDVTARITNGSMNGSRSGALHALYAAQGVNEDQDQDLTIQALTPAGTPMPPRLLNSMLSPISPTSPLDFRAPSAFLVTPVEPRAPEDTRLPPSPTRSDASATTPLEEKLLDGEIPAESDDTVDVSTADWGAHDYAMDDVAYNADGHLVLATLAVLVAKLTPHDQLVDSGFAAVFFLTFRLYTTPAELMGAIIDRYNLAPPARLRGDDVRAWQTQKGIPVRLRITGLLKTWLESYWRPRQDSLILDAMHNFTRDALAAMFPGPARRLLELIALRRSSGQDGEEMSRGAMSPRLGFALGALPPPPSAGEIPRPVMSKTLFAALRTHAYAGISITDFDATELARQLALLEHVRFAAIGAEEVLDMCREGAVSPASVKAVTGLSTAVTGWVTELILAEGEAKKRMGLVKFVIKLADRCNSMNNFATARSILAALDSSTIARLGSTIWNHLPAKQRAQLESVRKLADHSRNYAEYRGRLREAVPPAVPFLGLYLTDLTFCREGNPSYRPAPANPDKTLLNFNKFHKLARIVQDMQRFHVPYNLKAIPEVHEYLHSVFDQAGKKNDVHDMYRRSLLIEPKRPADTAPTDRPLLNFPWASSRAP